MLSLYLWPINGTVKEENIYSEYDLDADVDCDNDEKKYFSLVQEHKVSVNILWNEFITTFKTFVSHGALYESCIISATVCNIYFVLLYVF